MLSGKRQRRFVVLLGLACGLFTLLANAVDGPVFPKGKGDSCVAETDYMRANHMDLLNHQRDETVLDGVRENPFSLVGCVECHASADSNGDMQRVDAPGQFCQSCHTYAAVKIDCFGCHAAVPSIKDTAQLRPERFHNYKNFPSRTIAKLHGLDEYKSR